MCRKFFALLAVLSLGSVQASHQPVFAADLTYKAPSLATPVPACIWCGWYVGLNAGYVDSRNGFSTVSTPTPDAVLGVVPGVSEGLAALSTGSIPIGNTNGFIGGAQAGYNWQLGNYLVGVETDIQGLSRSGGSGTTTNTVVVVGTPVTSTQTATMSTSYLGTVRGRLGVLVAPTWLTYVTGGLAYGGMKASDTLFQTGTNGFIGAGSGSFSDTRAGWTLGGGMEWMFAPKWSVKAEYLHYDLGTANFTSTPMGTPASAFFSGVVYQTNVSSVRFQGDLVRAGINYHF
jgi:outer membrane immunogenic protein